MLLLAVRILLLGYSYKDYKRFNSKLDAKSLEGEY